MRFLFTIFLIVLISQVPQFLSRGQAQQAKQSSGVAIVRLGNDYAGKGGSLSVSDDDRVVWEISSRHRKQLWRFTKLGDNKFRVTNEYLGEGKSLDVNENGEVVMSDTGDYSGQAWTVEKLDDGKMRLTNDYTGEDKSLDVSKTKTGNITRLIVVMGDTGDFSGQAWTFTLIEGWKFY